MEDGRCKLKTFEKSCSVQQIFKSFCAILGMRVVVTSLFMFLLLASQASAITQVNIYVDNIGDALFLGTSDGNVPLPQGVNLTNGRINGYSSNLTVKEGEMWTFAYSLADSQLQVALPEGAVIKSVSPSEISLKNGQISLYAQDEIRVSYIIEKVNQSSSNSVLLWILITLLLLIGLVYGWNHLKRYMKNLVSNSIQNREKKRADKDKDRVKVFQHLLHERENLILAKLKETGKVKMSYLRKHCDMPKASFSRHVHELEKKKLIVLSGEGKNKFVESV